MRLATLALVSLVALTVAACGGEPAKPATPAGGATPAATADTYPLSVCVVSGEKLGGMGDVVSIQHEGREVRFCCKDCIAEFKKDPKPFLAKLDAAKK